MLEPGELNGHVIRTGDNGALLGMTPDEVGAIATAAAAGPRVVLHFQGGLVSEPRELEVAASLLPVYRAADAYPVFFNWRSDLLEVIRGNLRAVAEERTFRALVKAVLKGVVGQILGAGIARGALAPPHDSYVAQQLKRAEADDEPYSDLEFPADLPDLPAAKVGDLLRILQQDHDLRVAAEELVGATSSVGWAPTLLEPAILAEIESDLGSPGTRGGVSSRILARHAASVVPGVMRRLRTGRDHGLYVTVVEEVLREFYASAIGTHLWAQMKQLTADTFVHADPPRAGATFLSSLAQATGDRTPGITLVGHSAGAIFINHLLADVLRHRSDATAPHAPELIFQNVIFLAPACTFTDFVPVLRQRAHLWKRFRMFTMTDEAERRDRLVPGLYPRSLLYFVSGVLETGTRGKSEGGVPLVGLARWSRPDRADDPEDVLAGRAGITPLERTVVWSPAEEGGPGRASAAICHGDFDDDELVRRSLAELIRDPPAHAERTVNDLHFAVVVGIDKYPGYQDLQHAKRDALDFLTWLRSNDGGGLPERNVECVMATAEAETAFTRPDLAQPTNTQVERALARFNRQMGEHISAHPEDWERTRLYLFAAGHGLAPEGAVAAVLMANVDASPYVRSFGYNIELELYKKWYESCGPFHEVVLIADCCRIRDAEVRGTGPPWNTSPTGRGRVVGAIGLAATLDALAYEDSATDADAGRGQFTRALIAGLRGGAADPDSGEITLQRLAEYVENCALPAISADSKRPQRSSWQYGPTPVVLRPPGEPMPPLRWSARVSFPDGFDGQVELLADRTLTGDRWNAADGDWRLELTEGLYRVRPVDAPNDKPFAADGLFKVYGKDRRVQL